MEWQERGSPFQIHVSASALSVCLSGGLHVYVGLTVACLQTGRVRWAVNHVGRQRQSISGITEIRETITELF